MFMHSVASRLRLRHEVVFFDCFGGGAYRSPHDARHLARVGLVHIANTLAFRSLCDPVLPGVSDEEKLYRTFRRRLVQCVDTLSRQAAGRELVLFFDAIDNAVIGASVRSERPFPIELLEILCSDPVPGVKIIMSSRTERAPDTYAKFEEMELRAFNKVETASFLRARLQDVSETEINVAQARSQGNPRILDYLVSSDRGLLDSSEINRALDLEELIDNRIATVVDSTLQRGVEKNQINIFLAALGVLPPPVPLEELADATAIEARGIQSFVSDMFPLLEQTKQGVMFKDEPTETLVRNRYASSTILLRRVADNLFARQDVSVYASRALPGLLSELGDGQWLFNLAFDERIPKSITSTVGKRGIRYARLMAATHHAAVNKDYDRLVRLLVELSTMATVDRRGAGYIGRHPDLVVAARDVDSTRRLFETRTSWPGTRHARLAIAYTLSGDDDEASRHSRTANEWIRHYHEGHHRAQSDSPGPEPADIASIPFALLSQGRSRDAARYMKGWRGWYAYQVCQHIFGYIRLSGQIRPGKAFGLTTFLNEIEGIGPLAAALAFQESSEPTRVDLVRRLANLCKRNTRPFPPGTGLGNDTFPMEVGLQRAAAVALTLGLDAEARVISLRAPHHRPGLWRYRDATGCEQVFSFLFRMAVVAAVTGKELHEKDMVPNELAPICSRISRTITGREFRGRTIARLNDHLSRKRNVDAKEQDFHFSTYEEQQDAELFVTHRLDQLLALAKAFSNVLAAPAEHVGKKFSNLLQAWRVARKCRYPYQDAELDRFFAVLGFELATFVLEVRGDLKQKAVENFLADVHKQGVYSYNLGRVVSVLAQRESLQSIAGEQAVKVGALIEADDDVDSRASMFARLARAILPASIDEAAVYFRRGLEQLDAIGSGDIQYCHELLSFASKIEGKELDERRFHTLTNILELNLGGGADDFPQVIFGKAFSKTAGLKGLAKLGRWDDRSKISLGDTLLPYLTALIEDGKMEPRVALALNRLAKPREYFHASTKELAEAIALRAGRDIIVVDELIQQFRDDNPDTAMADTVDVLVSLAEETFGASSDSGRQMRSARRRYAKVMEIRNRTQNSQTMRHVYPNAEVSTNEGAVQDRIRAIVLATDPVNQSSLSKAIGELNALDNVYGIKGEFFEALRNKVPYGARHKYIQNIAASDNFFFPWKLAELSECKSNWKISSSVLQEVYGGIAGTLVELHADELVHDGIGRVSVPYLREVEDLTSVPVSEIVIDLIEVATRAGMTFEGGIWLGFASLICPLVDMGENRRALERLLDSDAARLAHNVRDGSWTEGLYPENEATTIASGLVWRMLGSPRPEDRWRAAHSVRTLAKFGQWGVIDALVRGLGEKTGGPFQAPELPFYYFHARLWLLIALARLAIGHPEEIGRYSNELQSIVAERGEPHVLIRHFALRALRTCIKCGSLDLPADSLARLRRADVSSHPPSKSGVRTGSFHRGRPESVPEPKFTFRLEYEFEKYVVDSLSAVFGKACWQVSDMISDIVHHLDTNISSMFDLGGRETAGRRVEQGFGARYHTYGEQLGWHALFIAAGKLLAGTPVAEDRLLWGDPWEEWLSSHRLTREDGYWLSDGMDRPPPDTAVGLLEGSRKGLVLTGDRGKLLRLVGIASGIGNRLVVEGTWYSADDIRIRIESALVSPRQATTLARQLVSEEPMQACLPAYHGTEERPASKNGYFRWIFLPSVTSRLDERDPYGALCGSARPRIASEFIESSNLRCNDPFHRTWLRKGGAVAARTQAWRSDNKIGDEVSRSGSRKLITSSALKFLLSDHGKDLLMLIKLERYERSYRGDGKRRHTLAAVRVTKNLDVKYFKGQINHLWVPKH